MATQAIKEVLQKSFPIPSTILEQFESVELTQEEEREALLAAKKQKYWKLQEETEKRDRLKQLEEATRRWSTDETAFHINNVLSENAMKGGYKSYTFDEHIKPVFDLLCQYFSDDPEFEKNGRSLEKGIMLIGDVGVGKTELMKAFSKNRRQCFVSVSCNEIEAKCRERGIEYWRTYADFVPGHGSTPDYFFQPRIGWMFDDLGTEELIKDFGNNLDPLEKIIHQRYMQKDKIPFSSLHLTTNLNGEMIEQRYGYRMRSRIREMFNVIKLPGSDRRK